MANNALRTKFLKDALKFFLIFHTANNQMRVFEAGSDKPCGFNCSVRRLNCNLRRRKIMPHKDVNIRFSTVLTLREPTHKDLHWASLFASDLDVVPTGIPTEGHSFGEDKSHLQGSVVETLVL